MKSIPSPPKSAPLDLLWLCRVHYRKGYDLPLHAHGAYAQLFLLLEGRGRFVLGDRENPTGDGHFYFAPPGLRHGFFTGGHRPFRTLEAKFVLREPALLKALGRGGSVFTDAPAYWRQLLEAIIGEGMDAAPFHREVATARLSELLWLMARRSVPGGQPQGGSGKATVEAGAGGVANAAAFDPMVRAVVEYLEAHAHEPFSSGDLSKAVGFSMRHVGGRFRQVTGETVAAWLWQRRLEHAKARMIATEAPLERIALECGFETVHHFSRMFKERTGRTPGNWRLRERDGISKGVSYGGFIHTPSPEA